MIFLLHAVMTVITADNDNINSSDTVDGDTAAATNAKLLQPQLQRHIVDTLSAITSAVCDSYFY
jgi:hypothetical protein